MEGVNHEILLSYIDLMENIDVLHCTYLINEFKETKWNINYLDILSAWNITVTFRLMLLIITWICWEKIRNRYIVPPVLHLLIF